MIKRLIRKTRIVIGSKLVGLGFLIVPDDYMWSFRCRLFEDRIKELEVERDAFKAKLTEYKMVASTIDNQWAESQDEITELKEKLAKAVEHIEWFISEDETNRGDFPMPDRGGRTWDEINAYWLEHLDAAIAFVAELKGQKPEEPMSNPGDKDYEV